jgi:MoaA/NifB/PqqE/SkfB family radical SAM enzyme
MGPTGRSRILQIHPTRLCNLRCLHCYSSSGPEERGQLAPALLRSVLTGAREEGFTVAGFSGGEPVLYQPLREVLDHAKGLGMITTVTSNGMLLDERRLATLAGRTDVLAISLDGVPHSHDLMRNRQGAFAAMESRLDGVRSSGIPFGFIFTLTQFNLDELPWVASFALAQGAALLQIHPLEITGRAADTLGDARPDGTESSWALIAAAKLQQQLGDRLRVQLDLFDREALRSAPERVFAQADDAGATEPAAARPLGELLSPLVLEPDGTLVPVHYGFARRFALGNVKEMDFRTCAERWRRELDGEFRALCREELAELLDATDDELPVSNWYERLGRRAAAYAARTPGRFVALGAIAGAA